MNADQLNQTWINAGKQIGATHRKFCEEKAKNMRAALVEMKAETGFAPEVSFYTNMHKDKDTGLSHFYWVSQINGDDVEQSIIVNIEKFLEYVENAQNVKFVSGKSLVMLQEAMQEFSEVIAPGLNCEMSVSDKHERVSISVTLGGMEIEV